MDAQPGRRKPDGRIPGYSPGITSDRPLAGGSTFLAFLFHGARPSGEFAEYIKEFAGDLFFDGTLIDRPQGIPDMSLRGIVRGFTRRGRAIGTLVTPITLLCSVTCCQDAHPLETRTRRAPAELRSRKPRENRYGDHHFQGNNDRSTP